MAGKVGRYKLEFERGKDYGMGKEHGIYVLKAKARPGAYSVPDKLAERVQTYQGLKASFADRQEAKAEAKKLGRKNRKAAWIKFQKKGLPQGFDNVSDPWDSLDNLGNVYLNRKVDDMNTGLVVSYSEPTDKVKSGSFKVTKVRVTGQTSKAIKLLLAL